MKYFVTIVLCLSAVVADIPQDHHSRISWIRDIHNSQHSQTVGNVRKLYNEELGGAYNSDQYTGYPYDYQNSAYNGPSGNSRRSSDNQQVWPGNTSYQNAGGVDGSDNYSPQARRVQDQAAPTYTYPAPPTGPESYSQSAPTYNKVNSPEYDYTRQSSNPQPRPSAIYTGPSNSGRNAGSPVDSNSFYNSNNFNSNFDNVPGSSRFGFDFSNFGYGWPMSSGLHRYMSESERLARLQAQDIGYGGFRTGSTQMNLDGTDSSADRFGFGNPRRGGNSNYRSKAWEKTSKWTSGTQFGADGNPNNYNLLSTAESENLNVNGKQTGYKAATTTLDDNGRVSTYSIHS